MNSLYAGEKIIQDLHFQDGAHDGHDKEVNGIKLSKRFNHTVTTKYFVDIYSDILFPMCYCMGKVKSTIIKTIKQEVTP